MAHLENDFLKISFPEQARVNAEEHAATLQRQRVIEEKKMKELEKIREQLETLLVGWLAGLTFMQLQHAVKNAYLIDKILNLSA